MSRSTDWADLLPAVLELLVQPPARRPPSATGSLSPELLACLGDLVACDLASYNDLAVHRAAVWATADSDGEVLSCPPGRPESADCESYFEHYWDSPCAHSDRTGDVVTAWTLSDLSSVREWRASAMASVMREQGDDFDREILLPLGGPPGHSRRLLLIRRRGRDFDARDRAVLQLLRPHLVAHLDVLDLAARGVLLPTARQMQLLRLLGLGYSNQQIARTLGLSPHTVRTHLQHLYSRLGVASRAEAVGLSAGLATTMRPSARGR